MLANKTEVLPAGVRGAAEVSWSWRGRFCLLQDALGTSATRVVRIRPTAPRPRLTPGARSLMQDPRFGVRCGGLCENGRQKVTPFSANVTGQVSSRVLMLAADLCTPSPCASFHKMSALLGVDAVECIEIATESCSEIDRNRRPYAHAAAVWWR